MTCRSSDMLAGGFPQPFSLVRKAGKGARRKVPVLPYKECDKRDDENNERQDDAHEKSPFDALPRLKPWDSGVTNVLRHLAMVLRELLPLDSTLPRFIVQTAC